MLFPAGILMAFDPIFFIGSGLGLGLALRQLDGGEPVAYKRGMFWFGLAAVSLVSRLELLHNGVARENPEFQFLVMTSLFALPPLLLWHFSRLLKIAEIPTRRYYAAYIVLIALAFIGEIFFQTRSPEVQTIMTNRLLHEFRWDRVSAMILAALALVVVQLGLVYKKFGQAAKEFDLTEGPIIKITIIKLMAAFLLLFLGFFLRFENWLVYEGIIASLSVAWLLVVDGRYPVFFAKIKKEVHTKKYARTSIDGIDIQKIKEALEFYMTEEKVYIDESIRIQNLAEMLNITSNQLSRILNEEYAQNFFEFVNAYRIRAAMEILRYEPKCNILAVAYKVGFNSKSAFNANFSRQTGVTPSAYRSQFKHGWD